MKTKTVVESHELSTSYCTKLAIIRAIAIIASYLYIAQLMQSMTMVTITHRLWPWALLILIEVLSLDFKGEPVLLALIENRLIQCIHP
jgi:ABC-type multidrug transport system permease subunit